MKYLFFDLEYATTRGGVTSVCEFGYVVTDEAFNIISRDNMIINPSIYRNEWNKRVVKTILRRSIEEYENSLTFKSFYPRIMQLINEADLVFGHSLAGDAKALNDECRRYELAPLAFDFYDISVMYKEYKNSSTSTSVKNILKEMDISGGDENIHDAEADAYNTMLELREMVRRLTVSLDDLLTLCPGARDRCHDFKVDSLERSHEKRRSRSYGKMAPKQNGAVTVGDLFGSLLGRFTEDSE